MADEQSIYRRFVHGESSIPIFSQDWWLDAVCGESEWDVALVESGGTVAASMPYYRRKTRFGQRILVQPPLTQTLGPWMRPSCAKSSKLLARQKDLLEELIDQLPPFDHFQQNWHYSQTNWLPFCWRGFQQTTRYTYVIRDLSDEETLWSGLQENIRREIRKARKRQLRVRTDLDLDQFVRLHRKTFERQGMSYPYSTELLQRLDAACQGRGCRQILIAEDAGGQQHAGVYAVWDKISTYYLMGGGDSGLRNSGATSLCMWEAILHAATVTQCFDFEGSMIESIERYFRAFGAAQIPYFSVFKTPSRLLRARNLVSQLRAR